MTDRHRTPTMSALFVIILMCSVVWQLHIVSMDEISKSGSSRTRLSLNNRTRLIATILEEPFMMLSKNQNLNASQMNIPSGTILESWMVEGLCADLARTIFEENLKIPYKFIVETKYGMEIEKDTWDGMIGALVNRIADAAVAPLVITSKRAKVVDFSYPFMTSGISLMMQKPEQQRPTLFSSLAIVSKEVWICTFVAYILVILISFFVYRLSSYEWYFTNDNFTIPSQSLASQNVFYFWLAGIMKQSGPRSISGRIVTGVWWFFVFILLFWCIIHLPAFSADQTSSSKTIQTIEDLALQTDIQYGVVQGGSTMAFFSKAKQGVYKNMWDFMHQHYNEVIVYSNREGIQKVRTSNGKYALFLESQMNEYVNEQQPCNTMRVGQTIATKGYGIATARGSDLREAVNSVVFDLVETGFLDQLKHKWYYERSQCRATAKKQMARASMVTLKDLAILFYILLIGLAVSVIVALFEFTIKSKLDSKRLNKSLWNVMLRNFRISMTGVEPEKQEQNNLASIEHGLSSEQ